MKKYLNSFCAVFVLAACLLVTGCKAPSGGESGSGSGSGEIGGSGSGSGQGGGGSGSGQGGGQQGGGITLYTKVDTQTIGNTTYDIVTFGSFPQSVKTDNTITVNESESKTAGSYTYYKGSDSEWYAKLGSKYYKVEPIKWRVLTTDYNGSKKKLLLAEKILINCMYYDYTSGTRDGTIYQNSYEHSRIRAYLNGLSYQKKESNTATQATDSTLVGKGFLQTAFTTEEQTAIATTTVINNARSTNTDSNAKQWNGGVNQYASDISTSDKIFLLSEQELTKIDYGFDAYNQATIDYKRIRMTTAFAKDSGASQSTTAGHGGLWWLRSPYYNSSFKARYVGEDGGVGRVTSNDAYVSTCFSVVPALCLN